MKERPILFSGPMVRAILEDRKTQTRREVKPQPLMWDSSDKPSISDGPIHGPEEYQPVAYDKHGDMIAGKPIYGVYDSDGEWGVKCPYGQPGDRLWVRETFADEAGGTRQFLGEHLFYRADALHPIVDKWTPSIYMPRWASRITLEIAAVRVERLQDISEADARAEGFQLTGWVPSYSNPDNAMGDETFTAKDNFAELWESINGAGSWDANPWVWVIDFKVVEREQNRRAGK